MKLSCRVPVMAKALQLPDAELVRKLCNVAGVGQCADKVIGRVVGAAAAVQV